MQPVIGSNGCRLCDKPVAAAARGVSTSCTSCWPLLYAKQSLQTSASHPTTGRLQTHSHFGLLKQHNRASVSKQVAGCCQHVRRMQPGQDKPLAAQWAVVVLVQARCTARQKLPKGFSAANRGIDRTMSTLIHACWWGQNRHHEAGHELAER